MRIPRSPVTLATVLVVALSGALLIGAAVPRFTATQVRRADDPLIRAIQRGYEIEIEYADRLPQSRLRAAGLVDRGQDYAEAALLEQYFAMAGEDGEVDRERLIRAEGYMQEALARAPVDPHGWARLAYMRSLLEAPADEIAAPLKMSLYLGPHEPNLTRARLTLCLLVWEEFEIAERDLVYEQARFLWSLTGWSNPSGRQPGHSKAEFVELSDLPYGFPVLMFALRQDPEAVAEFETMVQERRERQRRDQQ